MSAHKVFDEIYNAGLTGGGGPTPRKAVFPSGSGVVIQSGATLELTGTGALSMGGASTFSTSGGILTITGSNGISVSSSTPFLINGTLSFSDSTSIVAGTSTGLKICTTTSQKLGFFNTTPVVQPTALTAAVVAAASFTHTAPSTPDYAIQNLTQTTPFGFVTADEGNSVLKVIQNLVKRVEELEAKLSTTGSGLGLIA